jgi:phosphate:Na+ symporter
LVLGANLGSGVLAYLNLSKSSSDVRRVPVGNLGFKIMGCILALPVLHGLAALLDLLSQWGLHPVVSFHVIFNTLLALTLIFFVGATARKLEDWLPKVATVSARTNPAISIPRPWARRPWRLPAQPARPCTRPTSSRACCAGSCT